MRIGRVVFAFASVVIGGGLCHVPRAELLIAIDKSAQQMIVSVDGFTRYVWPVSTGAPATTRRRAQFKPFRMEAEHFSREWMTRRCRIRSSSHAGPRHPRLRPRQSDRHAGLAWLRAAGAA